MQCYCWISDPVFWKLCLVYKMQHCCILSSRYATLWRQFSDLGAFSLMFFQQAILNALSPQAVSNSHPQGILKPFQVLVPFPTSEVLKLSGENRATAPGYQEIPAGSTKAHDPIAKCSSSWSQNSSIQLIIHFLGSHTWSTDRRMFKSRSSSPHGYWRETWPPLWVTWRGKRYSSRRTTAFAERGQGQHGSSEGRKIIGDDFSSWRPSATLSLDEPTCMNMFLCECMLYLTDM